jgi:hypothetical protein
MNIEMLNERLKQTFPQHLKDADQRGLKDLGILNLKDKAIKFVCNYDAIYANGLPIITTCNDQWSTINAFVETMEAAYGNAFTVDHTLTFGSGKCTECKKAIVEECAKSDGPCPDPKHCNCMHKKETK